MPKIEYSIFFYFNGGGVWDVCKLMMVLLGVFGTLVDYWVDLGYFGFFLGGVELGGLVKGLNCTAILACYD